MRYILKTVATTSTWSWIISSVHHRLQRQLKPQGSEVAEVDLSIDQYADFCPVQTAAFAFLLVLPYKRHAIRPDQIIKHCPLTTNT